MIDINELTIKQVREITKAFGSTEASKSKIYDHLIGKYVIVRSRNEGINAGTVLQADETGVVIADARRIWYHKPADKALAWYEGVAISGLSLDSKISCAVAEKVIAEDWSATICSNTAEASIRGAKTHGQS